MIWFELYVFVVLFGIWSSGRAVLVPGLISASNTGSKVQALWFSFHGVSGFVRFGIRNAQGLAQQVGRV